MATFKRFKSLVPLQRKQGTLFEVVGDCSKLPKWFHTEHLNYPKTIYVDAWLVEAMFGRNGEYIPHVECVTRTLFHVNQWNPEEDVEILIFGPPYYQKDVSQMIMNLVNYFRKQMMQEKDLSPETQCLPVVVREAATQPAPVEVHDAATQLAHVEVHEASTQQASVEVRDAATKQALVEDADVATKQAPVEDRDAATQLIPVEAPEEASEAATEQTSGEVHQDVTQQSPVEVCGAATRARLCRGLCGCS